MKWTEEIFGTKKAVIGYFRFFLTLGCLQKGDFNFY